MMTRQPIPDRADLADRVFDIALFVGALLAGALLAGRLAILPLHIPLDYNEGWNAGFDTRAVFARSGPLYPGPDTLVFNNYPPLGFLVIGAVGRWITGDMIVAGRIVALLGLAVSAAMLGCAVRRLGGGVRAACASALMVMLLVGTYFPAYVAMDDPQWLAHAVMLAALAWLLGGLEALRCGRLALTRIAGACVLMVAAGFIKHTLVAVPLATTLWLLWLQPRAGAIWIGIATASIGAGIALTDLVYGPAALVDIFRHHRVITASRLPPALVKLLPLLPVLLVAVLWRRSASRPASMLVWPMVIIAAATGLLQRMGEGVSYNAHFETVLAVCLAFGVALSGVPCATWRGGRHIPFVTTAAFVFAALPVIGACASHLGASWRTIAERGEQEAVWGRVIATIRATPGPAGCEMLSLCYWAGKPFTVDLFNLSQHVQTGGSPEPFTSLVRSRRFAIIETDPYSTIHTNAKARVGHDPLMDVVEGHYVVSQTGPGTIQLLTPLPLPRSPFAPHG